MKLLKMMTDRRNPLFFFNLFRKSPLNKHEEISFSFTIDVEQDVNNSFDIDQFNNIVEAVSKFGTGTFFTDTKILEMHDLNFKDHEIASHCHNHSAVGKDWWLKKTDFKYSFEDAISRSTSIIRRKCKKQPVSFRGPKFSISRNSISILEKQGYLIDSSDSPHNPTLFPYKKSGITEIPVSRTPKPRFRMSPLPSLYYPTLMFSTLKSKGMDYFLGLSKEIVSYWRKQPHLVFMCHNWEFKTEKEYALLEKYFSELKKIWEIEFISMHEYYKKIN